MATSALIVCAYNVRPAPRKKMQPCGKKALLLVGTAKVPACHKCAAKFPPYVPKEDLWQ